ncbi:MAG TPA: hypothetical protein VGM05_00495 [Planctomycetaceae bacterium]
MKRALWSLILAAACGAAVFSGGAAITQAQDPYWNNHWRWHNNVYRPYYYRYYGPGYTTAPPVYNGTYNNGYYSNGYYAPGYSGYYSGPGYYGGGVQIGPLSFGWW